MPGEGTEIPTEPLKGEKAAALAEIFAEPEYRVEGREKVLGQARYAADARLPGMLWAAFSGSPTPHARIVSINTSAARALPGVHAVLTGEDIGRVRFGRRLFDWPVLAWDRVRFIGDRVAAVAAETREAAEEAVESIEVLYEELPAVLDPREALAEGAPILHERPSEYFYNGGERPPVPHPNVQSRQLIEKGDPDIERALASADHVFEHEFSTPRTHAGYIEPHATLVWIDGDGVVHVISGNKTPFSLREQLAIVTGLPAERIVVEDASIGGDFGGKGLSLDEFACYYLARETGRPVKAVMTYADELQATNTRHAATMRLRTGVTAEGRLVAHRAELLFDGGAYAAAKPRTDLALTGAYGTLAAYNVPHTRIEARIVYTNTVPGGHNRAPGEVQALFAGESHVDMIARELDMDPLEFRLLNAVRDGDTGPANERFREPRAVEVLKALRQESGWSRGPLPSNRGRGLALSVRHVGAGKTSVLLRALPTARIEVITGVPDQGAGSHTVIRRVAAAALSVAPERVLVTRATTAEAPLDPGAGASRVTHIVGRATQRGAAELKERLEALAADAMRLPGGDMRLERDLFLPEDRSARAHSFEEVIGRLAEAGALPVAARGEYDGNHHGHDEPGDFNFAGYAIRVEVDPETGQVTPLDVLLVADVGTIINPIAHQGQLEGGMAFGLGGALMEELRVEHGQVTTINLGEYKLPTSADMPPFRTVLLPTDIGPGPFRGKGVGELTNAGVAPAIANAVADAVGVRLLGLPISAERVFEALRGRGGSVGTRSA
jgi:CO/xanthine dehydrogenase Mo-binding subunit